MKNREIKFGQVALAIMLGLAVQSCDFNRRSEAKENPSREPAPQAQTPSPSSGQSSKTAQEIEDATVLAVSKEIRTAHLTELTDTCLAYRFHANPSEGAYLVDVRENHRDASCGGDPGTQPKLFTVRVDKQNQEMSSDKGTPGKFHAIKPQ